MNSIYKAFKSIIKPVKGLYSRTTAFILSHSVVLEPPFFALPYLFRVLRKPYSWPHPYHSYQYMLLPSPAWFPVHPYQLDQKPQVHSVDRNLLHSVLIVACQNKNFYQEDHWRNYYLNLMIYQSRLLVSWEFSNGLFYIICNNFIDFFYFGFIRAKIEIEIKIE